MCLPHSLSVCFPVTYVILTQNAESAYIKYQAITCKKRFSSIVFSLEWGFLSFKLTTDILLQSANGLVRVQFVKCC